MDRYIGRLLDNRYEILEVIGTGGMAVVYKARCHRLNRLVAIKILKDEFFRDDEFRRRFHAESQAVAMLGHPNIVQVYDVSSSGEADYIVMELIDGITLKQYMEKKGVLNWKETLHFGMQIAKALEHAHSRGIVHRDIKPHNVMVLKNGSVKVADFGIAQVMSKSNTLTKEALGSVHYISPEQAKGGRVDNRSDIYSLGVVMYEMMTGRPPYDGESPVAVAIKHINGGAAMPSTLNPNIPGGLEQIIMKGMAHEPGNRYATATAMLYDMEEFRKNPGILFGFSDAMVDEILMSKPQPTPAPQPPRTTAEQVAGTRQENTGSSRGSSSHRTPQDAQIARQRREAQEEANRSRVATIAIVACSAVAVLAIIVFLITLVNGGLFNQSQSMVPVPDLVNKVYTDLASYPGLEIVLGDEKHDETYAAGRIMHQEPAAGGKVDRGTKIVVTVSLGPEVKEEEKIMDFLVERDKEQAKAELNALGLKLDIREIEEYNDTVKEGRITRTDPVVGQPLKEGQTVILYISKGPEKKEASIPNVTDRDLETALDVLRSNGIDDVEFKIVEKEENSDNIDEGKVIRTEPASGTKVKSGDTITIWVSIGPEIKKSNMPNVVGMNYATAYELLKKEGFSNVDFKVVDSDADKDEVVKQPYPRNELLDVTTEIILEISGGPAETTEPPTTEPLQRVTKQHTIKLPVEGLASEYILTIRYQGGEERAIDDMKVAPGTSSVTVTFTGMGTQRYDVYINDEYYTTETVDFTANG